MQRSSSRRTASVLATAAASGILLLALAGGARVTSGQTPTPTPARPATAAATSAAPASSASAPTGAIAGSSGAPGAQTGPTAAPVLDDDTAVRMVLPASVNGRDQLPGKWARADMPNATGGYLVFISTIYPIYDGQGGATWYLLVNDLQWDGYQWDIGIRNYPGQVLSGDDIWLAQNLTDITAAQSPPGQAWQVFTVAYTADGLVSPTLSRTETVVEIYDLTLTTVWSRVDSLSETDTSNPNAVEQRGEGVTWTFQDLEGTGSPISSQPSWTRTRSPPPTAPPTRRPVRRPRSGSGPTGSSFCSAASPARWRRRQRRRRRPRGRPPRLPDRRLRRRPPARRPRLPLRRATARPAERRCHREIEHRLALEGHLAVTFAEDAHAPVRLAPAAGRLQVKPLSQLVLLAPDIGWLRR